MPRDLLHLTSLRPCPFLPEAREALSAASMRRFGTDRGPDFYRAALECAQSLWLQGLPAQALLLINRAMGAAFDGSEPALMDWPVPYAAAAWIMRHREEEQFIGNPRRHYQHLATRMVEPRKELRTWRAWACWYLAREIFPDYPADEKQIAEEGIREPDLSEIQAGLATLGIPGETEEFKKSLAL